MDFKEIIKRHLDKMAEQDAAFAERYALKNKSLDTCISYIKVQARKQAKSGFAAIEDAVVYGWAVHYYQEDDIKVDKVEAKVVTPKAVSKKETTTTKQEKHKEVKTIKALVSDKKNNGKCVQLDMFADMF